MSKRMTSREITRRRLTTQFLIVRHREAASDVVRKLGAVQAQDFSGAKWALGQRLERSTDAAIENEFALGRILRTHVLRPTWHFVAPEDLRWMLALTGQRIARAMSHQDDAFGLTPAVYRRSNDALANALAGGKHLTRTELADVLRRRRIPNASGQKLVRLVMRAELDAVLCSGARRGNQQTYALFDERVAPSPARDRDESLADLARRYFTTRGPATIRDFAWWSGLTLAESRRGLAVVQTELESVTGDGDELWFAPGTPPHSMASAHLLPNYDEYFIGYKDRRVVGERIGHANPVIGGDGSVTHVIFVDGQLVGSWKRVTNKSALRLELNLVAKLTAGETARVVRATRALETFLGTPLDVHGIRLYADRSGTSRSLRRGAPADESGSIR